MTTFDATVGPTVNQAPLDFSAGGNTTVINGLVGQRIKVLQIFFVVGGATNIQFFSAGNKLTGLMDFQANGSMFMDYIQLPLTCNEGESFIINLSSGVQLGGTIWYSQG